jgi:DinB superfamily
MTASLRGRPAPTEYASSFHGYVASVPEGDVVELLRAGKRELLDVIGRIPEARGGHRYGPDKWTIREVIGHLIDAERIFSYRALRIARGDQTMLPGFDENEYVKTAGSDQRTLAELAHELAAVRESTVLLFESFPDEVWGRTGNANGTAMSVRALAYVVAGHPMHHLRILRERYGVE